MQNLINISPNITFKKELKRLSGSSLNECMQCGSCSVVCSLAPDEKPFPRKEMIWAGWGMKERLIGNADIWLCHQCGDCSTYCPRGVNPSDVFSAIRQMSYRHYARPRFLSKILNNPAWLPIAILIPMLIITGILLLAGTFNIPAGPVDYSKFFPHAWLNSSFSIIVVMVYGAMAGGLIRFWGDMKSLNPTVVREKGIAGSFIEAIRSLIMHERFSSCNTARSRKTSHFLVFYGFILLLLVTAYAIYAAITHNYPLSLYNPFKILGNLAGLMLTTGLLLMIFNRLFKKEGYENSNYTDWMLIVSLFLLTITGFLVETARFLDWYYAYHIYFIHLITVWFVIIYLPYAKFGHIIFRLLGITYSVSAGRNQAK